MLTFWSLVLVWSFGQNPNADKPADAPAKPAEPAKTDQKAAPGAPNAPPAEVDSEHDKFIKAQADKLDKITSVSAEVVYTNRNQDQLVQQKGVYKIGPNNRIRMELAFGEGATGGKRLYVCDGITAYTIQEFGEAKMGNSVKMERVKPLLEDKNMTNEMRNQIWGSLVPYQKPGEMLRGFLGTMTFTERKDDKLGDREVVKLEGKWRNSAVLMLAGGDATKKFDDIDPRVPRYMTLVLDKQTGWPLQMEMFQRVPQGVVKPFISMKFSKLVINQTLPDADFKYSPPSTMNVQDLTPQIESGLKRFLDAAAAEAAKKAATEKKPAEPPKKP
jgi:outer membrane lipoprotein-sorting protein